MDWSQYGLLGVVLCAVFGGIAWAGKRLLGENGILEKHAVSLDKVADCVAVVSENVKSSLTSAGEHANACTSANAKVQTIHKAAVAALDELEQECKSRGLDVSARVNRVRRVLSE